jgi:Fe2+ or Zn2+ uptake regulation protein
LNKQTFVQKELQATTIFQKVCYNTVIIILSRINLMVGRSENTDHLIHHGTCPSCGIITTFDLLGIQRWPERVAKRLGFAREQSVWQCRSCHTTVMEASFDNQEPAQTS